MRFMTEKAFKKAESLNWCRQSHEAHAPAWRSTPDGGCYALQIVSRTPASYGTDRSLDEILSAVENSAEANIIRIDADGTARMARHLCNGLEAYEMLFSPISQSIKALDAEMEVM